MCDIHKLTCTHMNYAKYTHTNPGTHMYTECADTCTHHPLQMFTEQHVRINICIHTFDIHSHMHRFAHTQPRGRHFLRGLMAGASSLHNSGPSGHIWELQQGPNQPSKCRRHSGRCLGGVDGLLYVNTSSCCSSWESDTPAAAGRLMQESQLLAGPHSQAG